MQAGCELAAAIGATMTTASAGDTANWVESAAQFSRNADFYRGLLAECAKHLGPDVFICDDGSVSQDPLMLKIPELVATLKEQGRREALAYDPPIPAEIKDTSWKAEWFWAGVRAMKQSVPIDVTIQP
jgi:hypothetical protein